ncbi:MAG TPA: ATP-binding protein [Dehalococcoidia bacterium]
MTFDPLALIPLVSFGFYLVLFAIVQGRGLRTPAARALQLYLGWIMAWSLSAAVWRLSDETAVGYYLLRVVTLFAGMIPPLFLYTIQAYYPSRWSRPARYVTYASAAITLAGLPTGAFVDTLTNGGARPEPWEQWLAYGGTAWLHACYGFALSYLILAFRSNREPTERNRIKYLGAVLLITVLGVQSNLIPPLRLMPIDHAVNAVAAGLLAWSMVRHRLLNANVVIRRGFGLIMAGVAGMAGYLAALFVALSPLGGDLYSPGGIVTAVNLGLAFVFLVYYLRPAADRVVDRLILGKRFDHHQALMQFTERMTSVLSLSQLCENVTDLCARALDVCYVAILLPHGKSGDFKLAHVSGPFPRPQPQWTIRAGNYLLRLAVAQGGPVSPATLEALPQAAGLTRRDVAELAPYRDGLVCPIVSRDKTVGVLLVGPKIYGSPFSLEDLDLLTAVTRQAAVALENAQLYTDLLDAFDDLERTQRQLVALQQATTAFHGTLNLPDVLAKIREGILQGLEYHHAYIFLLDGAGDQIQPTEFGEKDSYLQRIQEIIGRSLNEVIISAETDSPVVRALLRDEVYVAKDIRALVSPPLDHETADRLYSVFGSATIVTVPLTYQGELVGGMLLMTRRSSVPKTEKALLRSFASQAAAAIVNARLYAELQQAYEDLQQAQEQLVRSAKLRALGEMAGGVAHDFNNILAGILARAQLAQRHLRSQEAREHLRVIEQAAVDGTEVVRRIQDLARLRTDPTVSPVDVNEVVRQAIELTRPFWKDAREAEGIYIRVETRLGDVPLIQGNAAELRQALSNIIINAVDAMPGGGTITIATRSAREVVTVSVTDTGTGMTEEVRRQALDPFFTTKGARGSGIGLSVVSGIVQRHQGKIEIESQVGLGTTICLHFPAVAAVPRPAPKRDIPARGDRVPVLVIDDDRRVGETLSLILQEYDYPVTLCTQADEGLRVFLDGNYGVVFTDLGMTGMSGWEVTRAVKKMRPDTFVVMVTGWAAQLSQKELAANGVDYVLTKPFRIDDVTACMSQAHLRHKAA